MPIDTAEAFVLIERAGTTGERVVMEDRLIEIFQFFRQVIGIAVLRIEMDAAVAVLFQDSTKVFLYHQ